MSKKFSIRKLLSMALLGTGLSFSGGNFKPMSVSAASNYNVKMKKGENEVPQEDGYELVINSSLSSRKNADFLIDLTAHKALKHVWEEGIKKLEVKGEIDKERIKCLIDARKIMDTILGKECYRKVRWLQRWVVFENTKKIKDYVKCYELMMENYMKTRQTDLNDSGALEKLTSFVRSQIDLKKNLDSDEKEELNSLFTRMIDNELLLRGIFEDGKSKKWKL